MSTIKVMLQDLSQRLVDMHYYEIIDSVTDAKSALTPWFKISSTSLPYLNAPHSTMVELLYMGKTGSDPVSVFGKDLTVRMLDSGFLRQRSESEYDIAGKRIIPTNGLLVISDMYEPRTPVANNLVWFGTDSLKTVRSLSMVRGKRVLDIGTGTGIIGLVLASRGAYVSAVDINPEAVRLAQWNIWLNGLEDRMLVTAGDIFSPFRESTFEYIVGNPPYLPMIKNSEKPSDSIWFADGGIDGLDCLRAILKGLPNHMSLAGMALFNAGGFGDEAPTFIQELNKLAQENRLSIEILIYDRKPSEQKLSSLSKELPNLSQQIMRSNPSQEPYYFSFLITVKRNTDPGVMCLECWASPRDKLNQLKEKLTN